MYSRVPGDGPGAPWDDSTARFLDEVRSHFSSEVLERWLDGVSCAYEEPAGLVITLPAALERGAFQRDFGDAIEACAKKAFGRRISVRFESPPPAPRLPPRRASLSGILAESPLNPGYTFDRFVVGSSNRLAHAAALAVAESPGTSYNPVFFHGQPGVGKTHLLQAICHRVLRETTLRARYLTAEDFADRLSLSAQRSNLAASPSELDGIDLLAIDELQFLPTREKTLLELLRAFNALLDQGRQLVLASRLHPRESKGVERRLLPRLHSGLVSRLEPPDYETRVRILRSLAEERRAVVPIDVVRLIAETARGDARELEGALVAVLDRSSSKAAPPSLDVAYAALRGLRDAEPAPRRATVTEILRAVQEHYGVRAKDFLSRSKARSLVLPRQVGMFLARRLTSLSLEEIGVSFGGRDHSTVSHAEAKIRELREKDPKVARDLDDLEERLGFRDR